MISISFQLSPQTTLNSQTPSPLHSHPFIFLFFYSSRVSWPRVIMFSSPTPVGKRPEFKQAPSSKWSMPHLVSMKEKKPQSTPASPTRRPSERPSSHDQSDQEPAPTTEGGKADPESRPLSPVLSTAGSATTTKGPDAAGRNEDMLAGETIDNVSTADSDVTGNLLTASEEAMPSWTEPAKGSATQGM